MAISREVADSALWIGQSDMPMIGHYHETMQTDPITSRHDGDDVQDDSTRILARVQEKQTIMNPLRDHQADILLHRASDGHSTCSEQL